MTPRGGWLLGLLSLALLIRLSAMVTQTYVIFADETFQYLEQGHRLAFGNGIVPWEYHDGIRSWLMPGLIAGLMRVGATVSADPIGYLWLVRGACIGLSLVVVWAGFRLGERVGGLAGAVLTGGGCALWFDLVWFAPVVLTETVAAHVLIAGAVLLLPAPGQPDSASGSAPGRHAVLAGMCFGLAVSLRYHYVMAAALIALPWAGLSLPRWRALVLGGLPTVLVLSGLLDWLSWGAPFQSIWLHALRNTADGISSAIGTDPPVFYLAYLLVALWPAPPLLALAVIGATRAPTLGLAALVTVLLHSTVPHKEVRFIYLALALLPILIGLGITLVLARFGGLVTGARRWAAVTLALLVWAGLSLHGAIGPALAGRWSLNRGPVEAFLAASRLPALCGLAARDMRLIDSGGYAYLHRDVPLSFSDSAGVITLPGSQVPLRFSVERNRRSEPLRPIRPGQGYNAMIAYGENGDPDLPRIACFPDPAHPYGPAYCLFHDPARRCD